MLLDQMPAAWSYEQRRRLLVESVLFAIWIREADRAADGVVEVDLTLDAVFPCGGIGVLEIGHEDTRAGIERVDDHLAVHRTGNLDAAVLQIRWDRRDSPRALADLACLRQKVVARASVQHSLALNTPL